MGGDPRGGERATIAWTAASLLAGLGSLLAVDAWHAGSLWRYRLVAYVVAAAFSLPLLTLLLFRARARRVWQKALFAAVPLLACLLLGEVLMHLFGPTPELPAVLRHDARLGHSLAPGTAGSDARGFRNPEAVARTDVLFVGDSQTWGFGVSLAETFAQRFAAATGQTCYQMANGSYGPVQYVELVRRGLVLAPERVVVVFYFGNDLIDATDYAGLEGAESLRTAGRAYPVRHNDEFEGPSAPNRTMAAIDFVLAQSRLLDAAATVVKTRLRGGVLDHQAGAVPFDHAIAPTILLPAYRRPTVDPEAAAVRDGLAVTARCWRELAAICTAASAEALVVTIPTKEYCYARFGAGNDPELLRLRRDEQIVRDEFTASLAAAGLAQLDLVDDLLAAMRDGPSPWFRSGDGHLNRDGHAVVAAALRRRLGG
jgi:hypothetical protein